jgi:hypothetical protein
MYHRAQRVGRGEGAGGDPVGRSACSGSRGDDGAAPHREDGVPPVDGRGLSPVKWVESSPTARTVQQRRARPLPDRLAMEASSVQARRRHDEVGERRAGRRIFSATWW